MKSFFNFFYKFCTISIPKRKKGNKIMLSLLYSFLSFRFAYPFNRYPKKVFVTMRKKENEKDKKNTISFNKENGRYGQKETKQ